MQQSLMMAYHASGLTADPWPLLMPITHAASLGPRVTQAQQLDQRSVCDALCCTCQRAQQVCHHMSMSS